MRDLVYDGSHSMYNVARFFGTTLPVGCCTSIACIWLVTSRVQRYYDSVAVGDDGTLIVASLASSGDYHDLTKPHVLSQKPCSVCAQTPTLFPYLSYMTNVIGLD